MCKLPRYFYIGCLVGNLVYKGLIISRLCLSNHEVKKPDYVPSVRLNYLSVVVGAKIAFGLILRIDEMTSIRMFDWGS